MAASEVSKTPDRLLSMRDDPRWHEVVLLALGFIGVIKHNQEGATELLDRIAHEAPTPLEPLFHSHLRLAAACIADDRRAPSAAWGTASSASSLGACQSFRTSRSGSASWEWFARYLGCAHRQARLSRCDLLPTTPIGRLAWRRRGCLRTLRHRMRMPATYAPECSAIRVKDVHSSRQSASSTGERRPGIMPPSPGGLVGSACPGHRAGVGKNQF